MQLHEIRLRHRSKAKKRIARGGKRGTYSGRGIKGQKSRAGRRIRPAQRDLILRIPKRRGFRNKPVREKPLVFNLDNLKDFSGVIDKKALAEKGIVTARQARREIKILGTGTVSKPITIRGMQVSKNAKMKIEKAGGTIEP